MNRGNRGNEEEQKTALRNRLAARKIAAKGPLLAGWNREMPAKTAVLLIVAFMVLAAGLRLRLAHLRDPMRNDEAFTYISYVQPKDYFDYSRPNNHILNTLLMAGSAKLWGASPAVLRMPAFIFGMLLIPAVGLLCFQLCGCGVSAVAAMTLAASSTALVEYSVNARGYSLVALAAVLMACLAVRLRRTPGWWTGWLLWAVCGVAGLYAIPVMIFAIAPPALLLVADKWEAVRARLAPMIVALVAVGLATCALYEPVIARSGLAAIFANPFVAAKEMGSVPAELVARFGETATAWDGNGSGLFVTFLCAGTLLCALAVARGAERMQLLALTGLLVAVAAAIAQRRVAPVRAYLYLQAWMIACACAGVAYLARGREKARIAIALVLMLTAAYDGYKVKKEAVLISEDPHTYIEASRVAAELIRWGVYRGDTSMIWNFSENLWPPLVYYFGQMHPGGDGAVSWNDPHSKEIFIVLARPDDIGQFTGSNRMFSSLYGEPRLIQVTANSCVYLAKRRGAEIAN